MNASEADSASSCEARLSRWDLSADERARILRESVDATQAITALIPQAEMQRVDIPTPEGWNAYNPSIAGTSRGLLMTARSSNWDYKRHHYFRVNADDGIPRNRCYLVEIGPGLTPNAMTLLQDDTDDGDDVARRRGYEDLRLFEHRGRLRAIATTMDFSPTGTPRMALLDIVGDRLRNRCLLSDGASRAEKNWSPAIWRDELFLVYAFAPMTLVRWDGSRLRRAGLETSIGPAIASDFRGGSQLIAIADGYLTVVHIGADFPDGSRVYLHRFVTLDDEFHIVGVSPSFTFRERGVEFAAGLAIRDGVAIVSFGAADTACWLARMPLEHVLGIISSPVESDPAARPSSAEKHWPETAP